MWTTDDDASSLELFVLDRWKFAPRWTLIYGTQFVAAERNAGGAKASYDSFNPRIGVTMNLGEGTEWFSSASRIYEAPTTFELLDEANGGSAVLDAMHGVALESGLRGSGSRGMTRLTWDVATYYTALRNEILSVDDPGAPGTSLATNIDKTTHAGIEALLGASLPVGTAGHRVDPLVNLTFNAFSFDSDAQYGDNRLPSAPRWFARGEALYRHPAGFYAGPTFDLVGPRYADFANSYRSGSYALLGARAGFASASWEIYADARNLLDRQYVATLLVKDVVSPDAEFLFPGAPRALYLGARYRF
jgi:iron complex outermembrane recepter protein